VPFKIFEHGASRTVTFFLPSAVSHIARAAEKCAMAHRQPTVAEPHNSINNWNDRKTGISSTGLLRFWPEPVIIEPTGKPIPARSGAVTTNFI